MLNKKGQGLSTNTIILIILGVLVLVILIIGFTMGWGTFGDWISPSNNVDKLVSACSIACNQDAKYDFCSVERELKIDQEVVGVTDGEKYTCEELSQVTELGISPCTGLCVSE